jgi:hypothetical protein
VPPPGQADAHDHLHLIITVIVEPGKGHGVIHPG